MLKSKFISLFLFFAFTVLQAHNVLPHHHHEHLKDIAKHHHGEQQDHQHHHEEDGNHQDEDEHGGSDLFFHFTHSNTSAEILHSAAAGYSVKKAKTKTPFVSGIAFVCKYPKIPSDPEYPLSANISISSPSYSSCQLRGPPAYAL